MNAKSEAMAAPIVRNGNGGRQLRDVAVAVALVLQLAVLVWGAALIKASVDNLSETMGEVKGELRNIREEITLGKIERARLETNQRRIEQLIERIP